MFNIKDCEEKILEYCAGSDSLSPLEMAMELMEGDGLRLHGPEHHFMTAAVLSAAWYRSRGEDSREHLIKLRERCSQINPGVCGYYGICGNSMAAGAFLSEALGAHYLAGKSWATVNRFTARVQSGIAEAGSTGPRCCKRTSFAAIIAAVEALEELLGEKLEKGEVEACPFSEKNKQCIRRACRFYKSEAKEDGK